MVDPKERIQLAIGYTFKQSESLDKALAHKASEQPEKAWIAAKLSWIGDAVVDWTISRSLFDTQQGRPVEELDKIRQEVVGRKTMSRLATEIGVGEAAVIGPALAGNPKAERTKMVAEILEAIFGAVYVESGLERTEKAVLTLLEKDLSSATQRLTKA